MCPCVRFYQVHTVEMELSSGGERERGNGVEAGRVAERFQRTRPAAGSRVLAQRHFREGFMLII